MSADLKNFRQDMSDWALHFTHDYNPDSEATNETIDFEHYEGFPYHIKKELNDRFDSWEISDRDYGIPDPNAFAVLLKIITDGHIRATWAFRNNRPTIYGPRAAVCFTEMPLYALVEYANHRKKDSVETYAIGIRKSELFAAGGRPVIYGLSTKHIERRMKQPFNRGWPRYLAPSCGIDYKEQYRYVAMSADTERPIDWSHEREWRWVDHEDKHSCPGLPIWLSEEQTSFTSIFIVVRESSEINRVLNRLQELYDAGQNDYCNLFCKKTLSKTSVISLDQLERDLGRTNNRSLRLDTIRTSQIQSIDRPEAEPEVVESVRQTLKEARLAADKAAMKRLKSAPRSADGRYVGDVAGWASLIVYDAQSPLVSALLQLGEAWSNPGNGYYIRNIGGLGWGEDQALSLAEAAVEAAKSVFEKHFPENTFHMETKWD